MFSGPWAWRLRWPSPSWPTTAPSSSSTWRPNRSAKNPGQSAPGDPGQPLTLCSERKAAEPAGRSLCVTTVAQPGGAWPPGDRSHPAVGGSDVQATPSAHARRRDRRGAYMAGKHKARKSDQRAADEACQDERISALEQQQAPPPQAAPSAGPSMADQLQQITTLYQ